VCAPAERPTIPSARAAVARAGRRERIQGGGEKGEDRDDQLADSRAQAVGERWIAGKGLGLVGRGLERAGPAGANSKKKTTQV
jgi:hypothetical protein